MRFVELEIPTFELQKTALRNKYKISERESGVVVLRLAGWKIGEIVEYFNFKNPDVVYGLHRNIVNKTSYEDFFTFAVNADRYLRKNHQFSV